MTQSSLLIFLFVTYFLHFVLRHRAQASIVSSFFLIAISCALLFSAWLFYNSLSLSEILSLVFIYIFFAELYLFLITFSLSSISANILVKLFYKQMSIDELEAMYSGEYMSQQRIVRLTQVNLVKEKNGVIYLTDRGLFLIKLMSVLRSIFCHDKLY